MKNKFIILLASLSLLSLSSCNFNIFNPGYSIPYVSLPGSLAEGDYRPVETPFTYGDFKTSSQQTPLPATGDSKILVLPIIVEDYPLSVSEQTSIKSDLEKAFFGNDDEVAWLSVSRFYEVSSFNQLHIDGVVADWYDCGYTTSELDYMNNVTGAGSVQTAEGISLLADEALAHYADVTGSDLSEFDSNNDNIVDSVWLIYSAPNYQNNTSLSDLFWAFTYWNTYYHTAPMMVESFSWASYDFMYQAYRGAIDTHTYIHETGHLLGLDDYYDGGGEIAPMGAVDMMDYNIIDHNAFSKFSLGWIYPYYVDKPGSIRLRPSATTGDALLIPTGSSWNGSAFDEYLLLEYYTPEANNYMDAHYGYYAQSGPQAFTESGVRIYHVDASLYALEPSGEEGYFAVFEVDRPYSSDNGGLTVVANSNSPSRSYYDQVHGEESGHTLIQMMDATRKRAFHEMYEFADNSSLFQNGDVFSLARYSSSFPEGPYFNDGTRSNYEISFSNMGEDGITITISDNTWNVE